MGGLSLLFRRRAIQAHPTISEDGYIDFADPEVFNVLMTNGVSADGIGISKADLANLSTIGQWFRNNTAIKQFPELSLTNITSLDAYAFQNCTSLEWADISNINKIGMYAFNGCTSLNFDVSHIATFGAWAFSGCTALTGDIVLHNAMGELPERVFHKTGINSWIAPYVTAIGNNFFQNSTATRIELSEGMTSIGSSAFSGCTALTALIVKATTPPTLGASAFDFANKYTIYVPDSVVDDYKAASRWSSIAGKIKGISEYNG